MKRKLIPAVLASALLLGTIACNNNNSPPFTRLVVPPRTAISASVVTGGQQVRLTTPGFAQSGAGAFDISFGAGAFDGLLAQFGPGTVSAKAVSLSELNTNEQSAILASSGNGAGVLTMISLDYNPTGNQALFVQGLHTTQTNGCTTSSQNNDNTNACHGEHGGFKVKNDTGKRCTPGKVDLLQIFGSGSTFLNSTLLIDDDTPLQNIFGDTEDIVMAVKHFIFCFECPRVVPNPTATPTATASPSPSPTASSNPSGVSGQSGAAGGAGSNGQQSAGGAANQ